MRRRVAGFGLGIEVAMTVLAALAIGTIAYAGTVRVLHPLALALPAASPTSSPRTPAAPLPGKPPAAPIANPPAGTPLLALVDLDLTDFSTGWILLTNCGSTTSGTCNYSVAGTLDAGATWTKPTQVGPLFDHTDGGGPRTVRFLNHQDGFVYG